jgi:hypothetical protein
MFLQRYNDGEIHPIKVVMAVRTFARSLVGTFQPPGSL